MSTMEHKGMHTLRVAAEQIGVTDARLRQLIAEGECQATKWEAPMFPAGYIWLISQKEIDRLRSERQGP